MLARYKNNKGSVPVPKLILINRHRQIFKLDNFQQKNIIRKIKKSDLGLNQKLLLIVNPTSHIQNRWRAFNRNTYENRNKID